MLFAYFSSRNILLNNKLQAKVADFGLSHQIEKFI